jgi:type IV pilus assembly protein PilQ
VNHETGSSIQWNCNGRGCCAIGDTALFRSSYASDSCKAQREKSELKLILETKGDGELPQVYTVNSGKDLVADIANTQLNLQEGDSFRQENPLPGITALVVSQSDANSVRVTVSGTQNSPTGQIIQTERQGITLGISPATKSQAADPIAVSSSARYLDSSHEP